MEFTTETVHMASMVLFLVLCQVWKGNGCSGLCKCCLHDNCGIGVEVGVNGWYNVCIDGCKDGYHQARCMNTCPHNCQTCKQADGDCLTCKPGFHGIQNDCLNNCIYPNCACGQTDCDFCLDGFYNTDRFCTLACSKGCYGGTCNNDGSCLNCIANFEGDKCDVCVHGKYGELCYKNCLYEKCGCKNATDCISCKPGYFDFSTFCSKRCSVGCRDNCENNGVCTCIPQFSGSTCEECKFGYYGDDCTTPCSNGCIDTTCKKDGICQCIKYFSGSKCETCVVGHYGELCQYQCGVGCTNNTCDRNYGTCECEFSYKGSLCNMCKDGYFGNSCNMSCSESCFNCSSIENCFACKEEFYGLNCSYQCSASCLKSRCDKRGGFCTEGCEDGFTAATCNDKCDDICKTCSRANSSHCTSCFGGFSGPVCKCIPNCRCELNSEVCNECTNGFEVEGKDCKCNKKYCLNSSFCTSCQNNTFYSFEGTCCECNTLCKNKQCSSENQCLNGCEDGYTGVDCADLCTDYDTDCTKCSQTENFCVQCKSGLTPNTDGVCARPCSETCVNKECDAKTGMCLQGCIRNFYADKCDIICPSTCASVPNKTRCDNYGRCLHGCIEGYKGVTCINATKANTGNSSAAWIIGGAVGGASTIIFVIIGIVLYIQRRKEQKKQSESGSQLQFRDPHPFIIEEQERHYQQLSDRQNKTPGSQEETYTELETNNTEYEQVDS